MSSIGEILEAAKEVKPIGEVNGIKITTFHDQNTLAQADLIEGEVSSGIAQMNPDGSVARSTYRYAAVNVDALFENRYKEITENRRKKLLVVTDYRACKEQSSGKIYRKTILGFVIARDEETNQLVLERTQLVQDDDFVKDFLGKLDIDAMGQILPLIQVKVSDITPTGITI